MLKFLISFMNSLSTVNLDNDTGCYQNVSQILQKVFELFPGI